MKEIKRIYNIVSFKRKANKQYLEGIQETNKETSNCIIISNWISPKKIKSFHITIKTYGNRVIIDSGVIEQLYGEIQRLKKSGLKKDALDKLFVINSPKDIYK